MTGGWALARQRSASGRPRLRLRPTRPSAPVAIAALAVALSLLPILALALGVAPSTGWIHRWCSPGAVGAAGGGLGREALQALEVHWPHFVPALIGLGTLVYLRGAERRHRRATLAGDGGTSTRLDGIARPWAVTDATASSNSRRL